MALPKRVKVGGIGYKGYALVVSSTPGAYVLNMAATINAGVNSIVVTPDHYGAGDNFKIDHIVDGTVFRNIADTIYNVGAGVSLMFDFAAMQDVRVNQSMRLTYTNVATTAMNVYTIIERIG